MTNEIKIKNNISFTWNLPADLSICGAIALWFLPKKKMQRMLKKAIQEAYELETKKAIQQGLLESLENGNQALKSKMVH